MKFDAIRGRSIKPFREIDIDFRLIPGLILAVVGLNGAGKSTFLELLTGGSLYRKCETHGLIKNLSMGPDSFIETDIVATDGIPYTIRHEVAVNQSWVTSSEVVGPLMEDRKVSTFDVWSKKNLPAPEVLYASIVSVQEATGFLTMDRADRMVIVSRALGIEALDGDIKVARAEEAAAVKAADACTAALREAKDRAHSVSAANSAMVDAGARRDAAEVAAQGAARALETARVEAETARQANLISDGQRADLAQATATAAEAERQVNALSSRLVGVRATTDDAETVRAAVARVAAIDAELVPIREAFAEAKAKLAGAEQRAQGEAASVTAMARAHLEANTQLSSEREKLRSRESIADAAGALENAIAEHAQAEWVAAAAQAGLDALNSSAIENADERANALRDAVDIYASTTRIYDGGTAARAAVEADGDLLQARVERPKAIESARATIASRREAVRDRARAVEAARAARARLDGLAAVERRCAELEAELDRTHREHATHEQAAAVARGEAEEFRTKVAALETSGRALATERTSLAPTAGRAAELAGAAALTAELTTQIEEAERQAGAAAGRRDALAAVPIPERLPVPSLVEFEQRDRDAARVLAGAVTAVALAERDLTNARAMAERVAELQAEHDAAHRTRGAWTRTANDLEGVRLMEIDAAGPELSEMTNDLLHHCFGPRFTVSINTQRADAKGKKLIDGMDVRVLDTKDGCDRPGNEYSPGQRVFLNEAISLALAQLFCRKFRLREPTLVRDETGNYLDVENVPAYVAMLRRSATLIGASKVIIVSHSPEVQAEADARLEAKNGRLERVA